MHSMSDSHLSKIRLHINYTLTALTYFKEGKTHLNIFQSIKSNHHLARPFIQILEEHPVNPSIMLVVRKIRSILY